MKTSNQTDSNSHHILPIALATGIPLLGVFVSYWVNEDLAEVLSWLSYGALGVFFGSILLSRVAGLLARNNRDFLFLLFRPGLIGAQLASAALVLLTAASAVMSLYLIEALTIHRVHFVLLILAGLAALNAAFGVIKVAMTPMKASNIPVYGKALKREEFPKLWSFIEALAQDLGTTPPDHIIAGMGPGFFVTEAPVVCMDGSLSGRSLYFSIPMCRVLNSREFAAILGHEFGHFIGADTRYSRKFFPIFRGSTDTFNTLRAHLSQADGLQSVALVPSIYLVSTFLESFTVLEAEISRARELQADQVAAKVSDVDSMASALLKAHAYGLVWRMTEMEMREALKEGKQLINCAAQFHINVQQVRSEKLVEGLGEQHLPHPTDSHPALALRLENLGRSFATTVKCDLSEVPSRPASLIVDGVEGLERELSDFAHFCMNRDLEKESKNVG